MASDSPKEGCFFFFFKSGLPYFIDLTCLHACFLKIYKVNWEGCRWGELSTAPVRSWDQLRFYMKQSLQPHRPVSRTLLICKCDRENGWFLFYATGLIYFMATLSSYKLKPRVPCELLYKEHWGTELWRVEQQQFYF